MKSNPFIRLVSSVSLILILMIPWQVGAGLNTNQLLKKVTLPPGFKIKLYAEKVPNARSMTLSPSGTVFVGTRKKGNVYAVMDKDQDQKADEVLTIAAGLNMPNGVAFRDGHLYVAEVNRIIRFNDIEQNLSRPPLPAGIFDGYPSDRHHGWKFIRFGPDGKLYVPVGAPCNICESQNRVYASLTRLNPDGQNLEIFAHGIRNTVGFDWHPVTQELWFTDNGRDWLGDDIPPDELNRAATPGLHFGYPYCHGRTIADPDFGHKRACGEFTAPAIELDPHVAALGMRFYTGRMFPAEYRHQIFIAEHGSWNRNKKIGYRISVVTLENNRTASYKPFAQGWKIEEGFWGRPVDLLVMPDGALLVSDDYKGAIYRISYQEPKDN